MNKEEILQQIKTKLSLVPKKPGCYQMYNAKGEIIYVGKAKILQNRLKSYFTGSHDAKTTRMLQDVVNFEYIITHSELEAFLLESNFIKKNRPKYNILLMDDKSCPYILITNEENPRLVMTRDVKKEHKKKNQYLFGPYPNAKACRDIVEILTSDNSKGPSRDWLKFVKSTSAKNKIQSWFKKAQKAENIEKGKELIEKELKRIGISHTNLFKQEYIEPMLDRYKYKNLDEMYAAVGFGANSSVKIIARMLQEYRKEHQEEDIEEKMEQLNKQKEKKQKPSSSGVVVKGIDNCLVKLSKCCNPLPGDEIVGYITKGRGVSVHRKDCVNVKDLLSEENRMIDVKWYEETKENYNVNIEVLANDRGGLLIDVLNAIKETKAKLMGVSTKTTKDRIAIMDINIEVENIEELNKVIRTIRKVDSVYEVRR